MNTILVKLQLAYESNKLPLMLWGVPGIGKTQIIYHWAKNYLNLDLITLHLSQMEAPDILGLPKAIQIEELWRTKYITPSWWPTKPVVLFLDEINRAQRFEINAVHQLVLEGRLFDNILPKGSYICAACNPPDEDETGLTNFGAAFWDRFAHVKVNTNVQTWNDWAKKTNQHDSVINFINDRPDVEKEKYLNTKSINFNEIMNHIHPTQRSWERISDIIKAAEKETERFNDIMNTAGWSLIQGLIGSKIGMEFQQYLISDNKSIDPEKILEYKGNIDPKIHFGIDRLDIDIVDKIKNWSSRSNSKLPLIKATLERCADHIVEIFKKNGGEEFYKRNSLMVQEQFGNFFELLLLCPKSSVVAFLKTISQDMMLIIFNIPSYYTNKIDVK